MSISTSTTVTANVNIGAGYSETFCISCTNDAGGLTLDTKNLDNYQVQQSANPCITALNPIAPSPTDPLIFTYHASNTQTIGDWTTFMTSTSSPTCDPTSCTLYGAGCSTAYATAYPGGKTSIAGSTPWAITAARNENAGWTETICVLCTNGQDTQQTDNFYLQQ